MCGLAGLLDFQASRLTDARGRILSMTARLHHRGPDAEGIWTEDGIALGHRRLAIVDLSDAGAQPMHSACGRYVIVFNGEIYNHLDLRADLQAARAAPAWRGHSDTETLLAGIAYWGLEETLRRAAGMFAIALWDRSERRLSLARDRIGEKPLYWGWAGSAFVFASELKALRAHPDFPNEVCRGALMQYLRFGYVPAPRSIHPKIYKLEPGCVLTMNGMPPFEAPAIPLRPGDRFGTISIDRYWSFESTIEHGHRVAFSDDAVALQVLNDTLNRAVARQMISDVPLGAFLSGGIDSSLIVALMQQHSPQPVKSFTIAFDNPVFDESKHAAAVARHLRTEHYEMRVTEAETRDVIPALPELYDEPFADSSQIPTHLVCRAARSHVTVALSGDAGDELFGGYNRYSWGPDVWRGISRLPSPLRKGAATAASMMPIQLWDQAFSALAKVGGPLIVRPGDKAHKLAAALGPASSVDDIYRGLVSVWSNPQMLLAEHAIEPPSLLDDPLAAVHSGDPAGRMMAQDARSYLPDDILCKVDRAAMGVSLETRAPFLDPDVIALSTRLPAHMKIRAGKGKWAVRQVLYRYVRCELIERPKSGFSIPIGEWLRGPLRPWAEELLSTDKLERGGLLTAAPIRKVWNEHISGRRDWTQRLWIILMLQAWREHWA